MGQEVVVVKKFVSSRNTELEVASERGKVNRDHKRTPDRRTPDRRNKRLLRIVELFFTS